MSSSAVRSPSAGAAPELHVAAELTRSGVPARAVGENREECSDGQAGPANKLGEHRKSMFERLESAGGSHTPCRVER
jgi:hypothetical protein